MYSLHFIWYYYFWSHCHSFSFFFQLNSFKTKIVFSLSFLLLFFFFVTFFYNLPFRLLLLFHFFYFFFLCCLLLSPYIVLDETIFILWHAVTAWKIFILFYNSYFKNKSIRKKQCKFHKTTTTMNWNFVLCIIVCVVV